MRESTCERVGVWESRCVGELAGGRVAIGSWRVGELAGGRVGGWEIWLVGELASGRVGEWEISDWELAGGRVGM